MEPDLSSRINPRKLVHVLCAEGEMRRFLDMWAFLLFICTPTVCSALVLSARLFPEQVPDLLVRMAGAAFLTSVVALVVWTTASLVTEVVRFWQSLGG